jgi:hypothetical protein
MQNPARRHHYVSQFYLKGFAADLGRPLLYVVNLFDKKSYTTGTTALAVENDFHTIQVDGKPPDAIEKALAQVEAAVKGALDSILTSESLSKAEDRGLLLYYISLLLVKSPFHRPKVDQLADEIMTKIGKVQAADKAAWDAKMAQDKADGIYPADFDGESVRKAILEHEFDISLTTGAHLDMELKVAMQLCPLLAQRGWNILKAKEGGFITSDRPVALFWDDYLKSDPIGLALPGTRLLFPLSPSLAICGGLEFKDALLELDAKRVAAMNGRTILNAGRQVFARDDKFEYYLPTNGGLKPGSELQSDAILNQKPAWQQTADPDATDTQFPDVL